MMIKKMKTKKKINILLSFLILFSIILFITGCQNDSDSKNINENSGSESIGISEEEKKYPEPMEITWEKCDNALGARYTFTLEGLCVRLQQSVKEMGVTVSSFDIKDWNLLSDGLVDDNGTAYSTYYYATDTVSYTAAVEDESKKVMNIGCGCPYKTFMEKGEDFQFSVITMSALMACSAGGYTIDELDFMYVLFIEVTKNTTAIYYNNGVYLVEYDEDKEDSAVLFIVSAADEDILFDWSLIDYRNYEGTESSM